MFSTCLRFVNDRTEAEDMLQESFTEAFRGLDQFEYRTSFGGWLKQICVNRCINHLKKRKVHQPGVEAMEDHDPADPEDTDETTVELKVDAIKKAIRQLPNGYRTVLNLYLLEGYDHEEIAGILRVAESTARTQYIRGKQKLVQLLNKK
jgi:RNA polymerase sigma-70 factor (ECF subfamily)